MKLLVNSSQICTRRNQRRTGVSEEGTQFYGIVRVGQSVLAIRLDQLSEVCHVERLDTLPLKSKLLLGGFDLRGNIVPVLNFEEICGLRTENVEVPLCVVIKRDERVLAFHIDEVLDISRIKQDQIQGLSGPETPASKAFGGVFHHKSQLVSIINVETLFDLDGVFAAPKPLTTDQNNAEKKSDPMLVFEAGGAFFALPAIEVYAAVPRQDVTVTAITAGPCVGEISYYNRRVPILCPIGIFGLGASRDPGPCEIVVLRVPDDRLIGFAVDNIRNIESFAATQMADLPAEMAADGLIASVAVWPDGRQVYVLNTKALLADKMISEIASLSSNETETSQSEDLRKTQGEHKNVIHERERYLVVRAGKKLAIPLTQVTCILDPPAKVTPARSSRSGFEGYFTRLGKSVTLFDLAGFLGMNRTQSQERRIVMTQDATDQIGFNVEKIISIEVSSWRERRDPDSPLSDLPAVQLGSRDEKTVLPLLDLEEMMQTSVT